MTKGKRFTSIGTFSAFFSLTLFAASSPLDYKFRRITLMDGLSQVSVRQMIQDREGFIWFATENGLNRYDGYEIQVFRHEPNNPSTMDSSFIYDLVEGPEGYLWVLTKNGVNRFDPHNGQVVRPTSGKGEYTASRDKLFLDSQGLIWSFGVGSGVERVNPAAMKLDRLTFGEATAENEYGSKVSVILEDRAGRLWFAGDAGLRQYDRLAGRFIDPGPIETGSPVVSLFEDDRERLWVGCLEGELYCLDMNRRHASRFLAPEFPNKDQVRQTVVLAQIETGELLIALHRYNGLWRFDPEKGYRRFAPSQAVDLENRYIWKIIKDRRDSYWIATYGEGLFHWRPGDNALHHLRYDRDRGDSLGGNHIISMLEERSGALFFADGQGVSVFDERRSGFRLYNGARLQTEDPRQLNVRAMHEDRRGDLWIGTINGLFRLEKDGGRPRLYDYKQDAPDRFGAICESSDGRLWVGDWGGELYRFDRERDRLVLDRHTGPNSQIYCMREDREGHLWLATNGDGLKRIAPDGAMQTYRHDPDDPQSLPGNRLLTIWETPEGDLWIGHHGEGMSIWRWRTERFDRFANDPADPASLPSNDVRALCIDREKRWWAGTHGGGLARFHPADGRFAAYTEKDGLPDNVVYGILEDGAGMLWLSTNNGLARFNPENAAVLRFDLGDNLQNLEFNTGAYAHGAGGTLYFGGVAGFNAFLPQELEVNDWPPPALITDFRVSDQRVPLAAPSLTFDHDRNFIAIEYVGLSYRQPEKNRFAYKMEGVDEDWVQAGARRFASYPDLNPGRYVFRVKAANNDGHWGPPSAAVAFRIESPFWRTAWFLSLVALSAAAAVFGAYRLRVRAIQRHNRILEQRVRQRTSQLTEAKSRAELASQHKSAFLSKVSHEIRTPLNAIIGFAEVLNDSKLDRDEQRYLQIIRDSSDTLLALLNDILDFNKMEDRKLKLECVRFELKETLTSAIRPFQSRAERARLGMRIQMDDSLPDCALGDPNRLKQIVFNLCSNAVKFTRTGGIQVVFSAEPREGGRFCLRGEVRDTGTGVPKGRSRHIFESFVQVDDSITRQHGGSGLGLAIVRELSMMMGGAAGVESPLQEKPFASPDPGSLFWFTAFFEVAPEAAPEPPPEPAPPEEAVPTGFRVLVAEDNRANQLLARKVLSNYTDRIRLVDNGQDAVVAVGEEPFDLVLMDIQMPIMDGYDATRRIKSIRPHLPVIGLSADVYPEAIERSFAAGMNDHLGKPFKKAALEAVLRQQLKPAPFG